MSLTPGARFGPYEIIAPLGAGGMGEVYRARDTKLNRDVAVKLLSGDLADANARRRFQREAQMASSLNHPHILTVLDAGELDGRQYLVTELVDGGQPWCSPRWTTPGEPPCGLQRSTRAPHHDGWPTSNRVGLSLVRVATCSSSNENSCIGSGRTGRDDNRCDLIRSAPSIAFLPTRSGRRSGSAWPSSLLRSKAVPPSSCARSAALSERSSGASRPRS